jgi:type I restriction enzyme, S subunit
VTEAQSISQLPNNWVLTTLGEIRLDKSSSINPLKTPDAQFELYSVPSFENKKPEILSGRNIGSNKITVAEDTVLLCKINPRINRVWIVKTDSDGQKIASTEWIPFFKTQGVNPKFLSYYLQQNIFRNFLAANVSGVGGSLMRVRPATLVKYPFPLAPTKEQERIVSKVEELFSFLDAGIASLHAVQAQLKRYRQAVLKHAFDGKLTEEWRKIHTGLKDFSETF